MNQSPEQPPKEESASTAEDATKSAVAPTPPPAVSAPIHLVCSFCDKHLPLDKYKKCNCKTTIYCMNASCQKEHWKVHKAEHRKLCKALNAVNNEGEKDDDTKSGSKNKTSPTIQRKPIQKGEKDECPICLGDIPLDVAKFERFTCCGKGIHIHCSKQLCQVKSKNIREYCPLCRTKIPTTNEESIKQIQKWVKKQKAWAQDNLGNSYYHGTRGVKKDVKRAFILFTLAAEQGDANAQHNLGVMYRDGIGTKPDVKRAVALFTLSAEQGLASAQYNLGNMYRNREGTQPDVKRAVELYTLSAEQGHAYAQYCLGNMYRNGEGTQPDVKRAYELYTLSAEQGLAKAQFNLGNMYATGQGVEQSFTTTQKWWTKAAAQGYEIAIAELKRLDEHLRRTKTTSTDDKKETSSTLNFTAGDRCLVHLLESEAGQLLNGQHINLVDGIIRNGRFRCRFEDGTIRNVKLNNLEKIQVTTGDDDSKSTSSTTTPQEDKDECPICLDDIPFDASKFVRFLCCGKGLHIHCTKQLNQTKSKNIRDHCPLCRTKRATTEKKSIKQVQKWVKKKKAWAQCHLGNKYDHGTGVKKDVKRAFVLYSLSAEQGDANAQFCLGNMYGDGNGTKPDVKRAVELYTLSAEQGLARAQFNLGCLYATGQWVEQSFTTARKWFQKAAAQKHKEAIKALKQVDEDIKRTTTTSTDNKKEISTQDDSDKKSTSSSTTTQQEEEDDECPICLEVLPKLTSKFIRNTCCGKGMHHACAKKQDTSKSMSYEQRSCCVLCRTKLSNKAGSKEEIEQLRFWVERGKAWAITLLGDNYRQGIGVPKDITRAFELYRMAAEQDYVSAIQNVGLMYYTGRGTEQDIPKAKELFIRAATLGDVYAILTLKKIDKHEGNTTPSFTPTRTNCSYCGVAHAPPKVKLNPCSGCYSVYYCSKEHQIMDWKLSKYGGSGHKERCKELHDLSK